MIGKNKFFVMFLEITFCGVIALLFFSFAVVILMSYFLASYDVVEREVGRIEIPDGRIIKCVREGNATVGSFYVFYLDEICEKNEIFKAREGDVKVVCARRNNCKIMLARMEDLLSLNNGSVSGWRVKHDLNSGCVRIEK